MINLFKMEWYQLMRNKIFWGGMSGVFLMGFFMADTYIGEALGPSGKAATCLADILNGMVYDSTFLLILVSCLYALLLGQAFSWRTIDQAVSAGHPRVQIYAGKIVVYLLAYNAMILIYPAAGCIREFSRYGIGEPGVFLYQAAKALCSSLLLNSAVLLVPALCCFLLRSASKALPATAGIMFAASLYLGYGMKLGLPVFFLPTYQIRVAVMESVLLSGKTIIISLLWTLGLLFVSWKSFDRCELK